MKYFVFKRSFRSFMEGRAPRRVIAKNLTFKEAQEFCKEWNRQRDAAQIAKGMKAEFQAQ